MTPESLAAARDRLKERLYDEGADEWAQRLDKCGKELVLRCCSCTKPRIVATRCDLKWCPSCQPALTARTADRYRRLAAEISWPLLVTFNIQHTAKDKPGLLRLVRQSHTKLRRQRWFKNKVPGGMVAYEVARMSKAERKKHRLGQDNGWHPHAHCLFDCKWFSVTETQPGPSSSKDEWKRKGRLACQEVAEIWSDVVGRKGSVHVRRVWTDANGGIDGAVHEIVKYATKGTDLEHAEGRLAPLLYELDRTRQVVAFGTLYGHPGVKRRRSAPAACPCGCQEWLPEDILARQARGEHGW